MKIAGIILLCFFWGFAFGQKQGNQFLIYKENNRFGFIDKLGNVRIKASFREVNLFSENLAVARIDGRFGFIDTTGKFVIAPQFEFATSFSNGIAMVYQDSVMHFINRNGKYLLDFPFKTVMNFKNGRSIVYTQTEKCGLINASGELVLDTVYSVLFPVNNSCSIYLGIRNPIARKYDQFSSDLSLIDFNGNIIVPFGMYTYLGYFDDGIIQVETSNTIPTKKEGFIDTTGKVVLLINSEDEIEIDDVISQGFVPVTIRKSKKDDVRNGSAYERGYAGFLNTKGELVFADTLLSKTYPFSCNRTIVQTKGYAYNILNQQFKKVNNEPYDYFPTERFVDGYSSVRAMNGNYGIIDTNAHYVVKPTFDDIIHIDGARKVFVYKIEGFEPSYYVKYGVSHFSGKAIIQPVIDELLDIRGNIIQCIVNNQLTYFQLSGKPIWQEKKAKYPKPEPLNISWKLRANYLAYSENLNSSHFGFGTSRNTWMPISKKESIRYKPDELSVVVFQDVESTIEENIKGIEVRVVNNTCDTMQFNAQDSRLYMNLQALDAKGVWRDIEYIPRSWCGNSYHVLFLPGRTYWTFNAPIFKGDFKTWLRFKLVYIDSDSPVTSRFENHERTIYSNVFKGSINTVQFWRKLEYSPNGIMDPYNE